MSARYPDTEQVVARLHAEWVQGRGSDELDEATIDAIARALLPAVRRSFEAADQQRHKRSRREAPG